MRVAGCGERICGLAQVRKLALVAVPPTVKMAPGPDRCEDGVLIWPVLQDTDVR